MRYVSPPFRFPWALEASRWPRWPEMALQKNPTGPKTAPRALKSSRRTSQESAKRRRGRLQRGDAARTLPPYSLTDGVSKMAPRGPPRPPRRAHETPKRISRRPETASRGPRRLSQNGSKLAPQWPTNHSKGLLTRAVCEKQTKSSMIDSGRRRDFFSPILPFPTPRPHPAPPPFPRHPPPCPPSPLLLILRFLLRRPHVSNVNSVALLVEHHAGTRF